MKKFSRTFATITALAVAALGLAACSSDAAGTAQTASSANTADINHHAAAGTPVEELVAQLPAEVADDGVLVIATDATIGEPFASYDEDGVTIVGIVPDLAYAIGDALGVDVELRQVVFANLIPGLAAGRYDLSLAPMLDTDERQQQVDFVDYLKGGSQFIVAKDAADAPKNLSPEDACGLAIGVTTGSVEEISLTEQNASCPTPIEIMSFKTNNEGILALTSGRIAAYATAAAQAGYIAQTDNERLALSGEPFRGGLSAMAFPKESELLPVVQATLQHLIDEGTYSAVLSNYGSEQLAVPFAGRNNEAAE